MNCVLMIQTDCCTNNCSKAEDEDSSMDEYEVGDTESEEEDIDSGSIKTRLD